MQPVMNLCMKHITCTAVMPCANAPTRLPPEKFKQLLKGVWALPDHAVQVMAVHSVLLL